MTRTMTQTQPSTPLLSQPASPLPSTEETFEAGIPGFGCPDLFDPGRLRGLHDIFEAEIRSADPVLAAQYAALRAAPDDLDPKVVSDVLVRLAPHVSLFVARLFRVEGEREMLRAGIRSHDPVFRFKVDFVRR